MTAPKKRARVFVSEPVSMEIAREGWPGLSQPERTYTRSEVLAYGARVRASDVEELGLMRHTQGRSVLLLDAQNRLRKFAKSLAALLDESRKP